MRLYLEVLEGDNQGHKYSLTAETSLGRKGADIELADPRLSSIHAIFSYSESQGWVVADNKSRNGVWVNGLKEVKMVLKDGDIIQLGGVKLVCRMVDAEPVRFSDEFQIWTQSLVKQVRNSPPPLSELKPPMRLKVIQGVQYGQSWDIHYGPRVAGKENLDICLHEELAPKDCFYINVKSKYAYFATEHESLVKLNDQSVKAQQFKPGDIITIGESQILVEFDEGDGFSS
jgi:hypothetical protein